MIRMKTFNKVLNFFEGNIDKTKLWFDTPNPLLGNVRPKEMAFLGRHKKLDAFIDSALDGNFS